MGDVPPDDWLSLRLLQECAGATTDFVGVMNLDRTILYLNPAGRRALGIGLDEQVERLSITDYHPASALEYLERVAFPAALAQGTWSGEIDVRTRAGRVFPTSAVLVCHRNEAGEPSRVSAIMREVSDSREREERTYKQRDALLQLATSDAVTRGDLALALRAIALATAECLEVERVGMWFFEDDQRALACRELYERSRQRHSSGRTLRASDFPNYFSALLKQRAVSADDARTHPATCEFAEGYLNPAGITSMLDAPIRSEGRLVGVVCSEHLGSPRVWSPDEESFAASVADLVSLSVANQRRREAEQEQRELEAGVQRTQRLEGLGVLAGGVAHDFNNLLQGMFSHLSLALERLPEDSESREPVLAARHVAEEAAELSRQMLAYANHRRGSHTASVDGVIHGMRPLLEASCGRRARLELSLKADRPLPLDEGQLRQIVLNLVTNAAEACEPEGEEPSGLEPSKTVRVLTRELECGEAELRELGLEAQLSPGTFVELEVSDSGSGMAPGVRAQIFENFFSTKGTERGIGLASVQGILRATGGAVIVSSEPGAGSRFRVLLPAVNEKAQPEPPPALAKPERLVPGARILLADDQPTVLHSTRQLLEYLGCQVDCATDGVEALEAFDRSTEGYQCVILDVGMPRLGGIETLERLRQRDPAVRALLVSGYGDTEFAAGDEPALFLSKPYGLNELQQALKSLLAGSP